MDGLVERAFVRKWYLVYWGTQSCFLTFLEDYDMMQLPMRVCHVLTLRALSRKDVDFYLHSGMEKTKEDIVPVPPLSPGDGDGFNTKERNTALGMGFGFLRTSWFDLRVKRVFSPIGSCWIFQLCPLIAAVSLASCSTSAFDSGRPGNPPSLTCPTAKRLLLIGL